MSIRVLSLLVFLVGCSSGPGGKTIADPGVSDTGLDPDTGDGDTGEPALDPRFDDLRAAIEADLRASDAPGVSVAIYEDGVITFAEAFGSAHPTEDMGLTPETLFQIGSTTKMLTAIALLQDVEDGALALEDSLAMAYPDSEFALNADWNDQIQLHHLLTHQGGFYEYYDSLAVTADSRLAQWHEDIYFPNLWLMNPPGEFWNYNNINFSIAGLITESLDGRPYPTLMGERVFAPLGMDRTYQRRWEAEDDGDYALGVGYIVDAAGGSTYGPVLMHDVPDAAASRPAGSCTWSTPSQMMAVADFLMNGAPEVLGDELRTELTTSHVSLLTVPDVWDYGYGLMLGEGLYLDETWQRTEVWTHAGNTMSYSSSFLVLPEHNFAISILSSGYGTNFGSSVATAITTLVDLGAPELPPSISADPKRLEDHEGSYSDAYNVGEIIIAQEGAQLTIEMPYLDELGYEVTRELVGYSDTVFAVEVDGYWYQLTFIGEPGSPSQYVRTRWFVGTRVYEEVDPVDEAGDTGEAGD